VTEPVDLADRIAALSDEHAVFVLRAVLDRQGMAVDPFEHTEDEARLREALSQPEIVDTVVPQPDATPGDLARTALTHLAEDDATADLVGHAMTLPPTGERDLGLFVVGSLVLFAFHSDIKLRRDPDKGWSFEFKTKPLSDTAIAKALGQLLGIFTK
jgi:hypothetical protein